MCCVYCLICIIGSTQKSSRKTGNPVTGVTDERKGPEDTVDTSLLSPILR